MINHATYRPMVKPATDLSAMATLADRDFVECCYLTIFNRVADSEGLTHYTQRLRAGDPRVEVLSALYQSNEARSKGVDIPWISKAIEEHVQKRKMRGVLRRFVRRILSIKRFNSQHELDRITEDRMNGLESQTATMLEGLTDKMRILEERTGALEKHAAAVRVKPDHGLQESVVDRRDGPHDPGAFLEMSWAARQVVRDLSSALREKDAGSDKRPWL